MNRNDAFVSEWTAVTNARIVIEALWYAQIAQVQFAAGVADFVDWQHRQNGVFDGYAIRVVATETCYWWINGQRLGSVHENIINTYIALCELKCPPHLPAIVYPFDNRRFKTLLD